MTSPIFYCDPERVQVAGVGDCFAVMGKNGHHAKNVLRLRVGEGIDISDGCGRRLVGEVSAILSNGVEAVLLKVLDSLPQPRIYLVQALAKHDRDLLGIETATELGVTGVVPWCADRSIVQWKKERIAKAHNKWEKTVTAAAKQARRDWIPPVSSLYDSTQLAQLIEESTAKGSAVFVLHERGQHHLTDLISHLGQQPPEIYIVVGPEGGINDREIELFTKVGAKPALLGKEVLRSSTAGSAALATLNVLLKHW